MKLLLSKEKCAMTPCESFERYSSGTEIKCSYTEGDLNPHTEWHMGINFACILQSQSFHKVLFLTKTRGNTS